MRTFIQAFADKILAALVIAAFVAIGFGPDRWVAVLVAGAAERPIYVA